MVNDASFAKNDSRASWRSWERIFTCCGCELMKIYEVGWRNANLMRDIRDNLLSFWSWWYQNWFIQFFHFAKSTNAHTALTYVINCLLQNFTHRTHPSASPRRTTAHPRWITTTSMKMVTRRRTERTRVNSKVHPTNVNFATNRSHVWATWRNTSRWVLKLWFYLLSSSSPPSRNSFNY